MAAVLPQTYELVRLDQVRPHPDNPRRGDLAVIGESIDTNGFYGALVVQASTGYILAGNHRYLAAQAVGLDTLPAVVVDVDDERARRILLTDNRTGEKATWDETGLAALLAELAVTGDGLAGSGFTEDDLAELAARTAEPDFEPEPEGSDHPRLDQTKERTCPSCGYTWRIGSRGEVVPA